MRRCAGPRARLAGPDPAGPPARARRRHSGFTRARKVAWAHVLAADQAQPVRFSVRQSVAPDSSCFLPILLSVPDTNLEMFCRCFHQIRIVIRMASSAICPSPYHHRKAGAESEASSAERDELSRDHRDQQPDRTKDKGGEIVEPDQHADIGRDGPLPPRNPSQTG